MLEVSLEEHIQSAMDDEEVDELMDWVFWA